MKALLAVSSAMLLAAPSFAQNGPTPGVHIDQGITSEPSDSRRSGDTNERGERLICRTQSNTSVSRMGARRVCHTSAEWREIARRDQD